MFHRHQYRSTGSIFCMNQPRPAQRRVLYTLLAATTAIIGYLSQTTPTLTAQDSRPPTTVAFTSVFLTSDVSPITAPVPNPHPRLLAQDGPGLPPPEHASLHVPFSPHSIVLPLVVIALITLSFLLKIRRK